MNGFRRRLYTARQLVKEKLTETQTKMKAYYDKLMEDMTFLPGDQVLVLSTLITSPFQAKFTGPYTVLEKLTDQNYLISVPDKRKKQQVLHVKLF